MTLAYVNYGVGWLGPLSPLIRLVLTPVITYLLLVPPIEQLFSSSEIFFGWDGYLYTVVDQWFGA